jgi:hypothetical protein
LSSEPLDRPAPAPLPPGGGPPEPDSPPLPSEPERWPQDDGQDDPALDDWAREGEEGDAGWAEPEAIAEPPRLDWPRDDQEGPGLELTDDGMEPEETQTIDDWEREPEAPGGEEQS